MYNIHFNNNFEYELEGIVVVLLLTSLKNVLENSLISLILKQNGSIEYSYTYAYKSIFILMFKWSNYAKHVLENSLKQYDL